MISAALVPGLLLGIFPSDPPADPTPQGAQEQEPRGRVQSLIQLPEGFVQYARVPEGGLYPRVGVGQGELALLFYKGGEEQGDLFVARTRDEARSFTPGVQVNADPASVACSDAAHGAIDVGPDGAAHVAWTTSGETRSIRYARVADGASPTPPIDLGAPPGLCSSVAVTVDGQGRISLFYAAAQEPADLEVVPPARRVWMRRSLDGVEFSPPVPVDRENRKVSEHSGLAAHVDEVMGTTFVLYRTGYALKPDSPSLSRGMCLLYSEDGETFESSWVDNWKGVRDPRSNAGLTQEDSSTLAVWESGGEVYWSVIRRQVKKMNVPINPRVDGPPVVRSKPAGAAAGGEVLLAWLERPKAAPTSPPRVAWRVWMREGRAPLADGTAPEALAAAEPAVIARAGGGFTILY